MYEVNTKDNFDPNTEDKMIERLEENIVDHSEIAEEKSKEHSADILIRTLEDENQKLKAFVPNDILINLTPELQQSLLQEVYEARVQIIKKDLTEIKKGEILIEQEKESSCNPPEKEEISPPAVIDDPITSNLAELMEIVGSLDEETSKNVYEELQNVLAEIDSDIKTQKIISLREEV